MILGTNEIRTFSSEDAYNDAKNLIDELETTIQYEEVGKKEMLAGEIVDCPIVQTCHEMAPVPVITTKPGVAFPGLDKAKSFTISKNLDEQVLEAMSETRMCLGMTNEEGVFKPTPVAYNALPSLIAQAIGGKSSLLCQTEDKSIAKPMRAETKAAIVNECLSLRKDDCKVYICDGMVRYIASNSYSYLPISELIGAIEEVMGNDFPEYTFKAGVISHQYTEFSYVLNNEFYEKRLSDVLSKAGILEDYKLGLIFGTSNTGDSGANIYPVLVGSKGNILMIEEPIKMEHVGEAASIEKFKKNLEQIAALVKSTPEKLDKLAEIGIKNPVEAFKNAAFKAGLPVSSYAEQANIFASTFGVMATMLDLYVELSQCLDAYATKSKMDALRKMKFMSSLSRVFLDKETMKLIDIDIDIAKLTSQVA